MLIPPETFKGKLKSPWTRRDGPGGTLYFTCETTNVVGIKEDIKTLYGIVSDYAFSLGLNIECVVTTHRKAVGKYEIPGEHSIFWEDSNLDDMYSLPLDGFFNMAQVKFRVTEVIR